MTSLDLTRDEPDVTLDLPTVAKQNWKSKEHRDSWDDQLGPFSSTFEQASVAALSDEDHPRTALTLSLSTEEVVDVLSELPDDVSVDRTTEGESTTLALASSDCPVDATTVLEGDLDPIEAQVIRGVPECCAEHYDDRRQAGQADPIADIARNTPSTTERAGELVVEDPHPILNLAWSYLGWRFVDFYPCSFECDAAREVGVENGRVLRDLDYDETAEAMFEFLAAPTYWSGYHGLAHVKNGWCIGQYTTDDYWHEEVVRFNGYHEELAGSSADGC